MEPVGAAMAVTVAGYALTEWKGGVWRDSA